MTANHTKHFADLSGKYLGGYGHGARPQMPISEYVETTEPPNGAAIWDGAGWIAQDVEEQPSG